MEENRKAAEAVSTPYFKNKAVNILNGLLLILLLRELLQSKRENKNLESIPRKSI